jgi:hypothetical protein
MPTIHTQLFEHVDISHARAAFSQVSSVLRETRRQSKCGAHIWNSFVVEIEEKQDILRFWSYKLAS